MQTFQLQKVLCIVHSNAFSNWSWLSICLKRHVNTRSLSQSTAQNKIANYWLIRWNFQFNWYPLSFLFVWNHGTWNEIGRRVPNFAAFRRPLRLNMCVDGKVHSLFNNGEGKISFSNEQFIQINMNVTSELLVITNDPIQRMLCFISSI